MASTLTNTPTRPSNFSVLQPAALQTKMATERVRRTQSGSSVGSAVTRVSGGSTDGAQSLMIFPYDRAPDTCIPAPTSRSSSRSHSNELDGKNSPLLHGDMPYKSGWLALQTKGGMFKKTVDRYAELAGPFLSLSASPNTAILGTSYEIFGSMIAPDKVPGTFRITVKTAEEDVLILTTETKEEYQSWYKTLQRSAERHINQHYLCDSVVGATPFGSIANARGIRSRRDVSVRITRKADMPEELLALARREAMILLSCPQLPSIPRILDAYETPCTVYTVTEKVPVQNSIRSLVQGRRPLSERDTSFVMFSLLQTLAALHERGIAHRGCTVDSVLLSSPEDPENGILLTSFEFAIGKLDSIKDCYTILDAIRHRGMDEGMDSSMAPFVAPEASKDDFGSLNQDAWAAGVIMHYCLVAATPFDGPGQTSADALRRIRQACGTPMFRGVMWDGISRDAKDLCSKLLHADPRRRLSPKKALSHRWFRWNEKAQFL
jgi:serine/threonine protein kinase